MKNQFLLKGYYLKFFFEPKFFFLDRIFFFFESQKFFDRKIKINPNLTKKIFHIKKKKLRPKKDLGSKKKIRLKKNLIKIN